MPAVGKRLRKLRNDKGLSQKEVGAPLFTHAYISQIEAGKREASPRALQHLARKLEVDIDELITGRPIDLQQQFELRIHEARVLLSAGSISDARALYDEVAQEASHWGLERIAGLAAHGVGLCIERTERWEDAIEVYESAESRVESRFSDVHADLVAAKARCLMHLGDTGHAMYVLDRMIRDLERRGIDDPLTLVKLYAPLAFTALEAGMYTRSAQAAARALELQAEVDDPLAVAIAHVNVARVLLAQGEPETAQRAQLKAAEMFDRLGLRLEMGRAHLAYGFTRARSIPDKEAGDHLDKAHTIFRDVGSHLDEARALVELGRLKRLNGHMEEAAESLRAATSLLTPSPQVAELALAHRELGLAQVESHPELAEKNLRHAVELYERTEAPIQLAITYRHLGELAEAIGGDGCTDFRQAALSIPVDL